MNVNLEYYRVFYYVCVHGSLTAAARELCISQPAVSQAVRQLEKEAGIKLFLRTSKGVQLTKEGELLYRYVKIWKVRRWWNGSWAWIWGRCGLAPAI